MHSAAVISPISYLSEKMIRAQRTNRFTRATAFLHKECRSDGLEEGGESGVGGGVAVGSSLGVEGGLDGPDAVLEVGLLVAEPVLAVRVGAPEVGVGLGVGVGVGVTQTPTRVTVPPPLVKVGTPNAQTDAESPSSTLSVCVAPLQSV